MVIQLLNYLYLRWAAADKEYQHDLSRSASIRSPTTTNILTKNWYILFPTDDEEFLILYAVYFGFFIILLAGLLFSKHKNFFKQNLIFYSIYTAIMILVFLNGSNFKYGGSLSVLFWGSVFVLLHLTIFIFRGVYLLVSKRQRKSKS